MQIDKGIYLILAILLVHFLSVLAYEDENKITPTILAKKEPPLDRGEINEPVTVVIKDKYIRNLTWAERPDNFKEICSGEQYPDPQLREQCQIDILEYTEVGAPFVNIRIRELEGPEIETEVDCLFNTGKGIGAYLREGTSATEDESFLNVRTGRLYEGTYSIRKPPREWDRFIELGDEYCEFGLIRFGQSMLNTGKLNKEIPISDKTPYNIFKKSLIFISNLFEKILR